MSDEYAGRAGIIGERQHTLQHLNYNMYMSLHFTLTALY